MRSVQDTNQLPLPPKNRHTYLISAAICPISPSWLLASSYALRLSRVWVFPPWQTCSSVTCPKDTCFALGCMGQAHEEEPRMLIGCMFACGLPEVPPVYSWDGLLFVHRLVHSTVGQGIAGPRFGCWFTAFSFLSQCSVLPTLYFRHLSFFFFWKRT